MERIGVFQRAGKPLEGRHKIIMIRPFLHAFANGLRRVNRAGGSNRQSFRLKRGRCRRRWAGRRPFGDFGHGRRPSERRSALRSLPRSDQPSRPNTARVRSYTPSPAISVRNAAIPITTKSVASSITMLPSENRGFFHGVPSFSTFQIYYTPKSSFRKDTKRAEPACISARSPQNFKAVHTRTTFTQFPMSTKRTHPAKPNTSASSK